MYSGKSIDQCVQALSDKKKDYRAFQRLTEPHRDIVDAAIAHLEKVQSDAAYERHQALKESFENKEAEDDDEYDYESYARAIRGEPLKPASTLEEPDVEETDLDEASDDESLEATIELYSKSKVSREYDQVCGSNQDVSSWLLKLIGDLSPNKPFKVCNEHEVKQLRRLRRCFPNLMPVVDQIIGAATLSMKAAAPFELPNLLIDGPPGVGKTYLIQEVARLLDLPLIKLNMASLNGRFELVGGHRSYKDAEPSTLFKHLYECAYANPIVLLDEAECGDPRLYQPLYHIVEGQLFRDHFLNVDFRVDGANYIFITNDKRLLPPPLRSRLTELDAVAPSPVEVSLIIQRLYDDVRESSALFANFQEVLSDRCIKELSRSSLRVAKNRIKSALLGSAAAGSSDKLLLSELTRTNSETDKAPIGFLW